MGTRSARHRLGRGDDDTLLQPDTFTAESDTADGAAGAANASSQAYVEEKQERAAADIGAATAKFTADLEQLGQEHTELRRPVVALQTELAVSVTDERRARLQQDKESDIAVFDAPPVLPVSDAVTLSRLVDAVVITVGAGSTHRDELRRTVETLQQAGADIAGVVVVCTDTSGQVGRHGAEVRRH